MLTYRFRIYPTKAQEGLLSDTLETCRHLYNALLSDRNENGASLWELQGSLPKLKADNKFLRAIHSQVLQDVNFRLDRAFQAFFAGIAKHPKFRRKGRYSSFTYPQYGGFRVAGNWLRLSKIGAIKMKVHRPIEGTPKTCTIVRDIDQWYACISAEVPEGRERALPGKPAIGVDLGVTNLVTLSDGTMIPNPRILAKSVCKIKSLQRNLSRKQSGSNNREKTRIRLAKAWRTVRRQRDDFAHKLSDKITKEHQTIVFENLRTKNMVRNRNLASAIMDASWGQLRRLTAYKAERRGGRVILVDPRGTSQKCSGCGEVVPKELYERVHRCSRCGLTLDRDVNAARNILKAGLEQARAEAEPLSVIRDGQVRPRSKKLTSFSRG